MKITQTEIMIKEQFKSGEFKSHLHSELITITNHLINLLFCPYKFRNKKL